MEDKRNELVGKFNQLRFELGAVELGIDLAKERKQQLVAQLKATQTQYDQVSAQIEKAKSAAGINTPDITPTGKEPEVGLTEDAKREMAEVLKLQGNTNEAVTVTASSPSEAPAA